MKNYVIVNKNNFFKKKIKNSKNKKFFFITRAKDLSLKKLNMIKPDLIFFPHWSHIISKKILKTFLCIGFHSTPLPYGRGGSPIHNMVIRGFKFTKICAFKIESKLDSGSIYLKTSLSLSKSGHIIFKDMYNKICKMIIKLSKNLPNPKKQKGIITKFRRLTAKDGIIKDSSTMEQAYNLIKVLDMKDKNYLNAHMKRKNWKILFKEVKKYKDYFEAKAIFKKN
jgi:methionyl-tRNA formyltransferase